jgi:hypothetical protein
MARSWSCPAEYCVAPMWPQGSSNRLLDAGSFPLAPTPLHVPDEVLADLQRRLELARWPEEAGTRTGTTASTARWPTRAPNGGDPAEAFEVIEPSLPGFGFSTLVPENPDMKFWKVADLWHTLVTRGPAWVYLSVAPGVRLTTPFGGEIRPGRGRREIIPFGGWRVPAAGP